MEIVAQAGSANGDLALIGGSEARLDVDAGYELKDILQVRLASSADLRTIDHCDRAWNLVQSLARLREIRLRTDDRDFAESRDFL